ncbi:MAG: hypothetical protein V4514_00830 [Pseudomonadota bacterium]|uniref:hypothetical protein n=1 Tax=unclassified Phenylobacterium TaxID=2640670 RepID=UPI000ABB7598|nr:MULTISPECIES: hypothetical protein [unclassified Phenylobacterium]MBT9473024.1 hypothetical protein [Phenylobacterium sp.]
MTLATFENRTMSFRRAFEAEHARRDAARHAREEAERKQQEEDLARAEMLHAALADDVGFLKEKGLTLELRRYTVSLHHDDYLIDAYFEAGTINVRAGDKRTASTPTAAPRKAKTVNTNEEALDLMAQYLADETN